MKLKKSISLLVISTLVLSNVNLLTPSAQVKSNQNETLVGEGRWETAIKVSQKGWSKSKEAIIVNDNSIVDALAATPFADAKDAPILLTGTNKLDERTKTELKRLGVTKVYLIGGKSTLSENIEQELKAEKISIDRISGDDRYLTALELAKRLNSIKSISEIAVVNGEKGLVDAVSVGAAAADRDMPIILAHPTKGISSAEDFLNNKKIAASYVIGGKKSVSEETEKKLPNSKRIAGENRSETNAKVIEEFYKSTDLKNVYITKDGTKKESDLIDALAVGVLAAKNDAPIIVVGDKLKDIQKETINSKSFKMVTQVGGNGNEEAFKSINLIQEAKTYTVKTISELKEALKSVDANDIIDFKPTGTINEDFSIVSNYTITINLFGNYTNSITVNIPNGDVVNNNVVSNIVIEDVKDGTFVNKGKVKNVIVKDNNGCSILNDAKGKIENIEVKNESDTVQIKNNGTMDIVKIESGASKVELDNKGTVSNIKNDSSDTKVENSGTINKVEGTQKPSIDGNKPSTDGSNGSGNTGGGSSNGGGSTGGGSSQQPTIIVEKTSVKDSKTVEVTMKKLDNVSFDITGNEYKGNIISSVYENDKYILKLDRRLGENCEHRLNISSTGHKSYSTNIEYEYSTVIDFNKGYISEKYSLISEDKKSITIVTNYDKAKLNKIDFKNTDSSEIVTFKLENGKWQAPSDYTIKYDKEGSTNIFTITSSKTLFNDNIHDELNIWALQKKLPDNNISIASTVYSNYNDNGTINIKFDKEDQDSDFTIGFFKDGKLINQSEYEEKVIKNIKIYNGNKESDSKITSININDNTIYMNLDTNISETGKYSLKLNGIDLRDSSDNILKGDINFSVGNSEVNVSNAEQLKHELEIGTSNINVVSNINVNENLKVNESTHLFLTEGFKVNMNGHTLFVNGSVNGHDENSGFTNTKVSMGESGTYFNPEVKEVTIDGQPGIEILNIGINQLHALKIGSAEMIRSNDNVYITSGSAIDGVKVEEITKSSPSIKLKVKSGNKISKDKSYNVSVLDDRYSYISNTITLNKIGYYEDKTTLIYEIFNLQSVLTKALEVIKEYTPEEREKYKALIDETNSLIVEANEVRKKLGVDKSDVDNVIYEIRMKIYNIENDILGNNIK